MPHLPGSHVPPVSDRERDLDLVETSFLEGFKATKDVTSFLRLARIPFVGIAPDGQRLHLLRVETTANADVGSVTPMLGGGAVLYDPLPAHLVSHRKALAFVYHDGRSQIHLTFAEARRLEDDSGASRIDFPSAETPDR
ncbi:MAG: hypothetical protein KIS86_01445 [Devosia sp.]|nr:hypothetical protein [Devosia sp.]